MRFFHAVTHRSAASRIFAVGPFFAHFFMPLGTSPSAPWTNVASGISIRARARRQSTHRSSLASLPSASSAASFALSYARITSSAVTAIAQGVARSETAGGGWNDDRGGASEGLKIHAHDPRARARGGQRKHRAPLTM